MSRTLEVHVEGELGEPLLRYLSWSHYYVPEQTVVRVIAAPDELHSLLAACTNDGLGIERVRRIDPVPSRDRARDPGGRRPHGD